MPSYQVTAPDGRKFRVTAPERATQEQVMAYAQQNYQSMPQSATQNAKARNYTEDQVADALRKADAAGNTEDAQALADEIRRMRAEASTGSAPISVDLPDGNKAEFPAGTSREVMQWALRKHQDKQLAASGGKGPWSRSPATEQHTDDFRGVTTSTSSTADGISNGTTDTALGRLISGKRQAPSAIDHIGRELGLGARGVIKGGMQLAGMLGGDLINAGEAAVRGQPLRNMSQQGDYYADQLGLPAPETASERIGGDVTAAVSGGGGLMGLGRGMAQAPGAVRGIGRLLSSMPGMQLASMVGGSGAAGVTREAGGGAGAQTLASLAGGLGPAAGRASVASGLRGLMRGGEAGRANVKRSLADFAAVGATPSVGQATGSRTRQGFENLLSASPTSAGVMSRAAERQAQNIGEGLQARADRFFPNASAERAGRAVERGVDMFAKNTGAMRRALYWQADKHIPDTTTLPLSRTQLALADLTTPTPGAEATTGGLVNSRIAQIAQNVTDDLAANQGAMPYAAVKELRSRIGEELSDFALSADRPTAQYKRLYASLSQDLEEAARKLGPNATQAMKRANTFYKASADRLEQLERVVDKAGGPEKVFNAVMSGTQDGGTTLRAVMQSLPKEGQHALTGAVIKRMGLATKGNQGADGDTFSAQTFLTNWNGVSKEAKRALFDRHGPGFVSDMDKIARVAETIRNGSKVFANPSGTANRNAAIGYSVTLATALLTGQVGAFSLLAGGGAGANVLGRAMTNPQFVRWLARSTELPVSSLPQQVLLLNSIAAQTGDPDVEMLAQALDQANQQNR